MGKPGRRCLPLSLSMPQPGWLWVIVVILLLTPDLIICSNVCNLLSSWWCKIPMELPLLFCYPQLAAPDKSLSLALVLCSRFCLSSRHSTVHLHQLQALKRNCTFCARFADCLSGCLFQNQAFLNGKQVPFWGWRAIIRAQACHQIRN